MDEEPEEEISKARDLKTRTAWLKMGRVDFMTFVGKDVVAFAKGVFIILYNIPQRTETIYIANSAKRGEGVQCLVGYQSAYMYAFAEMSPCPRIFLVRYPSHEHISVLQDREKLHSYLAMSFAEMECLVCLLGIPSFEIVVWCWRTGEKLASEQSNLFSTDQLIRCGVSMPIGVGQLSRYENSSTLLMWEIHVCSKFCVLNKSEVKNGLDKGTYVTAFCWSPEGLLHITDREGNVYMVDEENLNCIKVCHWPPLLPGMVMATPNLLWMKGGVVVSGPDCDVKFFKRTTKTEWAEAWTLKKEGPLVAMAVNRYRDMLAVWTEQATLYQVVHEPKEMLEELQFYGQGFRLIQLIHPNDEYFATVGLNYDLCIWLKTTGELVERAILDSVFILDMACNPEMPYLALARSDGAMELFAVYNGVPSSLIVLHLCTEELTGVVFNNNGSLIVVACFKTGRIFVTQGLVGTGRRLKVLDHYMADEHIVSMIVTKQLSEQKLVLIVDNEDVGSPSGNGVCIYSLPKVELMYRIVLDRSYCEFIEKDNLLLAVPYVSRQLDIFRLDLSSGTMNKMETIGSCHQVRRFHIGKNGNHIISYGWDGLVQLRTKEDMKIFCTFQPHHRLNHGVKLAIVDYEAKYVITLGKVGNITCTEILASCNHPEEKHVCNLVFDETYFRRRTFAVSAPTVISTGSSIVPHKKMTWLQEKQQEIIDMEKKAAAPEIELIQSEFKKLKKELVALLDKNEKLPPEEQLDILDFDLDDDNREKLFKDAAIERDNIRRLLEAEQKDCDRLAEVIKSNSWDLMEVKGRCIKAMLGNFSVENFALLPVNPKFEEELKWATERRKLAVEMSKGDHFEPWCPSLDESQPFEEESGRDPAEDEKEENIVGEKEDPYALFGSSSHKFVPVSPLHCSQYEMHCSFNANSEIILLEKVCADLRLHFNKLFDEMYSRKQREMSLLAERNERLRTILSELEITCHAAMDVPMPVDATWSQEEQTERLVTITDEEVPETPYISPSQQDLLNRKAAEEERIRLLLAADNFRERALIVMMDGVLEVRWEDELKKEVPIPKCMIEKNPEDFTEADLKTVKEYEEKCRVLEAERDRYRKMLDQEYRKLKSTIKESLIKFDASLFELFVTKLKIESAMNHELLKILRIRQLNDNRIRLEDEENDIKERVKISEEQFEIALKELARLQEAADESHINYETNLNRDKSLAKKFKSEFHNTNATLGMIDQLAKFFKRRPKIQQRAALYPTLLNELASLVINPDQGAFIPPEFHDFLRGIDTLDQYSNCPSHIDENIWITFVRLRRSKIESEHKLKAAALELAEAETTLNIYTAEMKMRKEKGIAQSLELRAAREEKLRRSQNIQMQIVMPMGLVEIPLTGHISDFSTTVLIKRPLVEEINKEVKAAGAKKLAAMNAVTNYHRINKYKEWEYLKMKMECEDLETRINNIEGIKVTLEVKQYLKNPEQFSNKDLSVDYDVKHLQQVEENYKGVLAALSAEYDDLEQKIKRMRISNKKVDEEIINMKCDVSEQIMERDLVFEEEVADASRRRMTAIVKRSQLVKKIQQAHNDNMVLQTELELLRLKTYPTLKYKSVI